MTCFRTTLAGLGLAMAGCASVPEYCMSIKDGPCAHLQGTYVFESMEKNCTSKTGLGKAIYLPGLLRLSDGARITIEQDKCWDLRLGVSAPGGSDRSEAKSVDLLNLRRVGWSSRTVWNEKGLVVKTAWEGGGSIPGFGRSAATDSFRVTKDAGQALVYRAHWLEWGLSFYFMPFHEGSDLECRFERAR